MIVVPLIPIELQLVDDCKGLGLSVLAGSQVCNIFLTEEANKMIFISHDHVSV